MNYIEMYKNSLIPNMDIELLRKQKILFEASVKHAEHPAQVEILQMMVEKSK